jgi:dextranase
LTLPLGQLRCFYPLGEEIVLDGLPAGTARVIARRAKGDLVEAELDGSAPLARLAGLAVGTYSVEALDAEGAVLAEELTTVARHAGERPVHGFATSFQSESVADVLGWLGALRCTVVQIYDWMAAYAAPLGPVQGWKDPSGRPVSFEALRALAAGIKAMGAVAHAYAPVYAVDLPYAASHPEIMMYRGDGAVERFFDLIELANPANRDWQRHFVESYGQAADRIGFDGFHIDTYGYPRAPLDAKGEPIDMRAAYRGFLEFVRAGRPSDLISFNQVNGVPSAAELPEGPGFRYCEVWAPNDGWRHLEGLLDRSAGQAGRLARTAAEQEQIRGSIACYPPVWGGRRQRPALLRRGGGALRSLLPQARKAVSGRGGQGDRLAPIRPSLPGPLHRGRGHQLVRDRRR